MPLSALPLFHRVSGQRVVVLGDGDAAEAKRRLIERAGGICCGEPEAHHAALASDRATTSAISPEMSRPVAERYHPAPAESHSRDVDLCWRRIAGRDDHKCLSNARLSPSRSEHPLELL